MDALQPVLEVIEQYPDPTYQYYFLGELVASRCKSKRTAYHYKHAVADLMSWRSREGDLSFNEETLQKYAEYLREEGAAPGSIGRRLAGVRKLISKGR